jgi:hypothetical protein
MGENVELVSTTGLKTLSLDIYLSLDSSFYIL